METYRRPYAIMLFTTPCGARNSRISLDNVSYFCSAITVSFFYYRYASTFLPSDSSLSEDEGIQPVPHTVLTFAWAVRRFNHSARSFMGKTVVSTLKVIVYRCLPVPNCKLCVKLFLLQSITVYWNKQKKRNSLSPRYNSSLSCEFLREVLGAILAFRMRDYFAGYWLFLNQ